MILLFKYYCRLFPEAKKKVKVLSSFVLLCGLVNSVWAETSVRELRLWRSPDKTRVVLDLSAPATHKVFTLNNPDRVVAPISVNGFKAICTVRALGPLSMRISIA